jgi:hypothetical protein
MTIDELVKSPNSKEVITTDTTDLLKRVLAPNAKIRLNGCDTATGKNCLAQEVSAALPGAHVTGINGGGIGLAGGWWGMDFGLDRLAMGS